MLTQRHERLNALAVLGQARKYLEIGVSHGTTFRQVQVPYKVAVDPKFRFDFREESSPQTFFHETTSDRFFATLAWQHGSFDLIYLDGLHTFSQTFRDFCASLRFAHERTIWLIDDTHPTGPLAASLNRRWVSCCRRWFHLRDRSWMGDVYKVVFAVHDFFPQFSYATFSGHGQTAMWSQTRKDFTPTWNSLRAIEGLQYRGFRRYRHSHLNIQEAPNLVAAIRDGWAGA